MSLSLGEIYHATRNQYRLTLAAGEGGLSRIMSWVYVSEDINTSDFLCGGELIITTGICYKGPDWLFQYIEKLIARNTFGLIINTGKYITPDDITDEIRNLCCEHDFPLFLMPWEIHIYNITHDYYNRIFLENQTDSSITEALLHIIRKDHRLRESIDILEQFHLSEESSYTVCALQLPSFCLESDTSHKHLLMIIETLMKQCSLTLFLVSYRNNLLLIGHEQNMTVLRDFLTQLIRHLETMVGKENFSVGIGKTVHHLGSLEESYNSAFVALTLGQFHQKTIYSFEEMGFFQILFAVNDREILSHYVETNLGNMLAYDRDNHTEYTGTLRHYLLENGSIQAIAARMFCHRNTINYRLRILRENFGLDLDDYQTRFRFMTAFAVNEYLDLISKD